MKLMNVRLHDDDVAKVEELRRRGIEFSQIVREAVSTSYQQNVRKLTPQDAKRILKRIHAEHPDPAYLPPRTYSAHDARQARQAILNHLNSRKHRAS